MNNYCIIMAGGFGSRFWPISQANNPKQFIDILGNGESMLQTTFRRFERICPRENIIIVTNSLYADRVREQIPNLQPYQVLSEPYRRSTAPCIAYAAAIISQLDPNANIIVTPSDHAIFDEAKYDHDIRQALSITACHDYIVTIGIRPTDPKTKYGYIQFNESPALPDAQSLHKVITFTEKPPLEIARQFISTGEFFWNAGIFVWSLSTLRKAYQTFLPNIAKSILTLKADTSPDEVEHVYSLCDTISVDYGIIEHAENVYVLEASFPWSDVETWDLLYNTYPHDAGNNSIISGTVFTYDVQNSVVHIPANKTIVLQGLDGYIVAANDNTTLICRRDQEDRILKFISDVELNQMMGSIYMKNKK